MLALVGAVAVAVTATDCSESKYYSVGGRCNNLKKPDLGAKDTFYARGKDGADFTRAEADLPGSRLLSNVFHNDTVMDAEPNDRGLNTLFAVFGQFITHDISFNTLSLERLPVDLTESGEAEKFPGGQSMGKSVFIEDDNGEKQNVNGADSYLDLSHVYGFTQKISDDLRTMAGGLLKTGNEHFKSKKPLVFKYPGRFYDFCHKCMDTSTDPPTPWDGFRTLPGVEPRPTPNPLNASQILPSCFVLDCFVPAPHIKCELNPEWNPDEGKYRDIHYEMTREWLPLGDQVPEALIDVVAGAGQPRTEIFVTGDPRNTDNVALMTIHAMFLRNHNNIARELAADHPEMTDEELYQEARLKNTYQYQHIIYNEYLPALLSHEAPKNAGHRTEYDEDADPATTNLFMTASFRLHTTIPENIILRYPNGDLQSPENGFDHAPMSDRSLTPISPIGLVNNVLPANAQIGNIITPVTVIPFMGGEDAFMKSILAQPCQKADSTVADALRETGFELPCKVNFGPLSAFPPGRVLFDIVAASIERGRSHGIPSYDDVRKVYTKSVYRHAKCRCSKHADEDSLACFRHVTGEKRSSAPLAKKLKAQYKKVSMIDAYTGFLTESKQGNSFLGATQAKTVAAQFESKRAGDRLFYSHALSDEELKTMRNEVSLSAMLASTFDIPEIPEHAFFHGSDIVD